MEYKIKQNKRVYPIPIFPGYYISRSGDVWSEKSKRFLSPIQAGRSIRLQVNLWRSKIRYLKYIHRLVLETFIGPCPDGMECCHNNGNPLDNKLENLRWDTRSNNQLDSIRHGTYGRSKLNYLQVRVIRRLLEFKRLTQKEIAEVFKVDKTTISAINQGKSWWHLC